MPTEYIRISRGRYTPDFLIRHKETGKAFLVVINHAHLKIIRSYCSEKK